MTRKWILSFFLILVFIILGAYLLLKIAQGYKFDFSQKNFQPTGLLVATSIPDGAQIFVNGKLASATNTTISLSPNIYEVEIKKDGYNPWKKTLKIEKEIVTKTDAWLFPLAPDFQALTFTGAINPQFSPDGTKIAYQVFNNQFPEKNGIWVLDLSDLPLGRSREPKQIIKSALRGRDFAKAIISWSPDSRQVLATLKQGKIEENFLLDANNLTLSTQLVDITNELILIKSQWEKEENLKQDQMLAKLPTELTKILSQNAKDIHFLPNETKILYTATSSAIIPEKLISSIPGSSTQSQERNLKTNQNYIYDIKEDRNFQVLKDQSCMIGNSSIPTPTSTTKEQLPSCILRWFPSSKHLLSLTKDKVMILEYEDTNPTVVYGGSYQFPFAFPYPAGNKLLILTTLSTTSDSSANLYAVSLR